LKAISRNKINSEKYWDTRFQTDWREKQGGEQSVFFGKIAIEHLPSWFVSVVRNENFSICDWGCAQGEGTDLLATLFETSTITGVDFSKEAIDKAQQQFPARKFICQDFLKEGSKNIYNVLFSSNTLEHFNNPWDVFATISKYATDLVVLLLPFREYNRISEHFTTFDFATTRLNRGDWHLVNCTVIDTRQLKPSHWMGEQVLLIYAHTEFISRYPLTLAEINFHTKESDPIRIRALSEKNAEYESKLAELEKDIANKATLVATISSELHQQTNDAKLKTEMISVRDSKIAQLESDRNYLQYQLDAFVSSKRWVFVSKLSRIFNKLFPEHSFHRKLAGKAVRLIKHILREYSAKKVQAKRRQDLQTHLKPDPLKKTVAFQLETFDKGGLEEVVLSLASNDYLRHKFNVIIIVVGVANGYLVELAQQRGIQVVGLENDLHLLEDIVKHYSISICHLHYSIFGLAVYKKMGVKTVYTVHNNYIWADHNFVLKRREEYKKVDTFVAVSNQVKQYFSSKFEIDQELIHVVPNGVDPELLAADYASTDRTEYGFTSSDFIFISVSTFQPNKSQISLIIALSKLIRKHPQMRLLLVGNIADRNYYDRIQEMIKKYKVSDFVTVLDYLPKQKLLGLVQLSNCFILPSLTEGFSISTLEAMYLNRPMILSDVGGAREVIKNRDLGIIVKLPYPDILQLDLPTILTDYSSDSNLRHVPSLVKAMKDMYLHRKHWSTKAQKGKQKIIDYFNANRVARDYIEIFKSLSPSDGETYSLAANLSTSSDHAIEVDTHIVSERRPLVTVMLPIYNHVEFAIDSIKSVLQQTFQNWELIILDDGSTDGLLKSLEQFSEDPRIRIYTQKNQKLPRTLTHLQKLARGAFLTWTSADNLMEPTMLETLSTFLIANPQCALCYADVMIIDKNGNPYTKRGYRDNQRDENNPAILRLPRDASSLGAEADNYINACFMYRHEASNAVGGEYAADLTGLEDYDYWLRLSRYGDIVHIGNSEPLYRYRVHDKSMSEELQTTKREQHLARIKTFIDFEHKRADLTANSFNITVTPGVLAPISSSDVGSLKSIEITKLGDSSVNKPNTVNVSFDGNYYTVPSTKGVLQQISVGFDISPLATKARYHNPELPFWEYPNTENRKIIGIHIELDRIDLAATRKLIEQNQDFYFVFCEKNSQTSNPGTQLVEGLPNAVYLGYKPFGEPYVMYSTWEALLLPPLAAEAAEYPYDDQKTLAWACAIPLYYPEVLDGFSVLPLCAGYSINQPLPISYNNQIASEDLLKKYIDFYSTAQRIQLLQRVCNSKIQEEWVSRPNFGEVLSDEAYPTQVSYNRKHK